MEDPQVQYGAYGKVGRSSRGWREREEERSQKEYGKTPEGKDLANLKNEINLLKQRLVSVENGDNLNAGNGISVNGTLIALSSAPGAAAAATDEIENAAAAIVPLAPWKSAALAVSIRYGVINDNAGPHELSSYGPVAITATRYFFAKVTTDADGLITALDLHHQSTVTPPAFSDTVSYKYLGRAVVAGGVMAAPERQINGSQNYRRVGFTDNYTHLYETA